MLKLTRLMILVAVAFMVARPVMACCITGHNEAPSSVHSAETPSCHDAADSSEHTSSDTSGEMPGDMQGPMECPGCFDCDSAIMQAQTFDEGAVLTESLSEIPVALLTARFEGFHHNSTVLTTGPPGHAPPTNSTPITLKQRLLI